MSAFTAYFDASGTQHDQPCLAVAGYVALAEQWVDFEQQWTARLKSDGLEEFHAASIQGQWKHDQPRIVALYRDLIRVISDTVLRQFSCVIVNRSLGKWSEEDRDEWNMTAYSIAGRGCAGQLREWCRRDRMSSLPEMIFECGDTGKGSLIKLLESEGFPSPVFKPKKDTVKKGMLVKAAIPLQAADLLAYECFHPIREMEQTGSLSGKRFGYDALEKIPGYQKVILPKNMDDLQKFGTMTKDEIWLPGEPDDTMVRWLADRE